jgi:hypothetical protein
MLRAIAKKSGKEFTVVEMTEVSAVLRDDSGAEREIKISTLERNYDVEPITVEETMAISEPVTEEDAVVAENTYENEEVMAAVDAFENVESVIAAQILTMECDIEVPTDLDEAIRIRDNSRQAYKENEKRFHMTLEHIKNAKAMLETRGFDDYIAADLEQCKKAVAKYVGKMHVYLKRYQEAKDIVEQIRLFPKEQLQAEAEANVDAVDAGSQKV